MVKLKWGIVCQRALIDRQNNISIIQVLDEFGIPAPPADTPVPAGALIPFQLSVVSFWTRSDANKPVRRKARLRFLSPKGVQFGSGELDVDLRKHQRTRGFLDIPGIPYHGPGKYVVRFEVLAGRRWRYVGETEFIVHHNVPALAAATKH